MVKYEYKVVPAPEKGKKAKGAKGTSGRFAHHLESLMNELGAEGWEYLRSDTLPCQERVGLTGKTTTFQNMLVFRRTLQAEELTDQDVERLMIEKAPAPTKIETPEPAPAPQPEPEAPATVVAPPVPEKAANTDGVSAHTAAAAAAAALGAKRNGGATGTESQANVAAE